MTIPGTASSYDLTNGVIINMDEAIYLYSPEELPMLTGQGSDGLSVISTDTLDQVSFSWLDEENLAPRDKLEGAVTTGDAYITLETGGRLKFSTGDVLMVRKAGADEVMYVASYGTTADTLVVTRAFAGTATNYADAAVVIGLGTALGEGATPENFRAADTTTRTNNTQIFGPTKIAMTGTDLVIPRYGKPNEWTHQLYHRTYENGQAREQAILYGRKTNSTTTRIRTMGGLAEFVTTNVDATNTQITELHIQTNIQTCYNRGGIPDRLIANPNSLKDINAITDSNRVRTVISDGKRGRTRVTEVDTEYGTIQIVRNRWCHPFDAWGIKREGVVRRILRPFQFEMLAKTGDSQSGQILCEESLEVKGEKHMFRMNALAY